MLDTTLHRVAILAARCVDLAVEPSWYFSAQRLMRNAVQTHLWNLDQVCPRRVSSAARMSIAAPRSNHIGTTRCPGSFRAVRDLKLES